MLQNIYTFGKLYKDPTCVSSLRLTQSLEQDWYRYLSLKRINLSWVSSSHGKLNLSFCDSLLLTFLQIAYDGLRTFICVNQNDQMKLNSGRRGLFLPVGCMMIFLFKVSLSSRVKELESCSEYSMIDVPWFGCNDAFLWNLNLVLISSFSFCSKFSLLV